MLQSSRANLLVAPPEVNRKNQITRNIPRTSACMHRTQKKQSNVNAKNPIEHCCNNVLLLYSLFVCTDLAGQKKSVVFSWGRHILHTIDE